MGMTFDTLYKLTETCPTVCPDESRFNRVCRIDLGDEAGRHDGHGSHGSDLHGRLGQAAGSPTAAAAATP